ncbi:MAG: hypothetical protein ACE363_16475 [Alphaproteobacteria bacterium]
MTFDLFVGIDWSGAKGPRLPGLQVAACDGAGRLAMIEGPWTRSGVADWLMTQVTDGKRVLCGLDFSFCFPRADRKSYFPGLEVDPANPQAFWTMLETCCADDFDLYGGRFAETPPYNRYFHQRGTRGDLFERRLRAAEQATLDQGLGTPESVFNLVGARQVGKSSLAGMRFLLALKQHTNVAVWPFDEIEGAHLVLVETFPTAFVRMAGAGTGKVRDKARLDRVLSYFKTCLDCHPREAAERRDRGSILKPGAMIDMAPRLRGDDNVPKSHSDDQTDALITAAALRHLAGEPDFWNPPSMSDMVRRTEGWTFGIL